jgi:putative ubiquitin-RnfH superfamily antitoxin RatB of RatAB toxin-antitoxin module
MAAEGAIAVELVYALRDEQEVVTLSVAAGTTVREAIAFSGVAARYPQIDAEGAVVGIHGRIVAQDAKLHDGDRVEIYRPLKADPKQARRRRATPRRGGGSAA